MPLNDLIFLSAQHFTTYYLWQVQICISNLASKGIGKEQIHVLFATYPNQQFCIEDLRILKSIQQLSEVFFYEDNRKETKYPSSIRPHIISKHFLQFLQLQNRTIFYHDCDILFRELPPLLNQIKGDVWYVSDTANYLDSSYIKRHIGEDNFIRMCQIVGICPLNVMQQDSDCGGAQYIMNKLTPAFWQKVEKDSESIYSFLQSANRQMHIEEALEETNFDLTKGIQSWCADMWALLWNAIYFKHTVEVHPDLNFSWPKNKLESWNKHYILHNAGVDQKEAEEYFYKGNYIYNIPFFESFAYVNKKFCSCIYADAIKLLSEEWQGIPLVDLTFLIPVMIDSQDRLDNLYSTTRYLQKHFDTHIIIQEYGRQQIVSAELLPKKTRLLFEQGDNEMFHHTSLNNKLIDAAQTPFISIYDTDVILPVEQIVEAIRLLRTQQTDMVYPYDGSFVSMDKLSSVIFSKFLDDQFLVENNEKFIVSSRRSFGGCVMLNKEHYRKAGKDNTRFISWGPEDIERYQRMKILGYRIERVSGSLYHMHHERGRNSGYAGQQARVDFMEEYSKVFNMKKNELEKYVSNW